MMPLITPTAWAWRAVGIGAPVVQQLLPQVMLNAVLVAAESPTDVAARVKPVPGCSSARLENAATPDTAATVGTPDSPEPAGLFLIPMVMSPVKPVAVPPDELSAVT